MCLLTCSSLAQENSWMSINTLCAPKPVTAFPLGSLNDSDHMGKQLKHCLSNLKDTAFPK